MKKQLTALCLTALLALGGTAGAADLTIPGLGTIPLGKKVTITDGGGTEIEKFLISGTHAKDYGKSAMAAMWSVLTVPPGMNLYPEKAPYPYDTMHMYQIKTMDARGIYSGMLYVFHGTADTFFHEGNKKAARFWETAFREDAERPTALFGLPKITPEEFQHFLDEAVKERGGQAGMVKILSFTPWRAMKNDDGSYRWAQEARVILTTEKGLSFPMWISSTLYKEGDTYYLIGASGSHASAVQLSEPLLFGFFQIHREGKERGTA